MNEKQIKIIDVISQGLLVSMFLSSFFFYKQLPDSIPTHFGADGAVDGYGPKWMLFLLPIIAICTYALVKWTIRFSLTATVENLKKWSSGYRGKSDDFISRSRVYSARQMSFLNFIMVLVFSYIQFISIRAAQGISVGLGKYFIYIFVAVLFIPIFNMVRFQFSTTND